MAAVSTIPIPNRPDADELFRLRAEVDTLRSQVETLSRQRDHYAEQLRQQLLTYIPEPPTEVEFASVEANPTDLSDLIAQLERK